MTGGEPIWIETADALALHDRLLAFHGGSSGVRDEGLLQSALARARQIFAYEERADLIDLASAATTGIIQNHPFIDGNKRTGFVVGILFLEMNGLVFAASEHDTAEAVMALAAGDLDEAGYSALLRQNVTPDGKR